MLWSRPNTGQPQANGILRLLFFIGLLIIPACFHQPTKRVADNHELMIRWRHSQPVKGAIALSQKKILGWSKDRFYVWDSFNGNSISSHRGPIGGIGGAIGLPNGSVVSWADGYFSKDTRLTIWSPQKDSSERYLRGHRKSIVGALLLSSHRLLSWSWDRTLCVWQLQESKGSTCDLQLVGHEKWVLGATQLQDGRIVSWSKDRTIRIWSHKTGRELTVLHGHKHWVLGVLQLAQNKLLSWSADGSLRIWDMKTRQSSELQATGGVAIRGAITTKKDEVWVWCSDGSLQIWNLLSKVKEKQIAAHQRRVLGMFTLYDGTMVSWSVDGFIRLWSMDSRTEIAYLAGHRGEVRGVMPLHGKLLSWSSDGTFRYWSDKQNGLIATLLFGTAGEWVVVSPDKRFDGTLDFTGLYFRRGSQNIELHERQAQYATTDLLPILLQ